MKIKKYLYFAIISLIIIAIQFNKFDFAKAYTVSRGECVIELESGRVLYKNNEQVKLPMASTTKILTALTVIENFDLNKEITVPKSATGIEGSSIYLREGEKLTVKELLYGLMLRSGNDCAECLATTLVSKDEFICLMNKTARLSGAFNSNFTNPHGLHDENHYTTAYDLAMITRRALKNSTFKEICSTKRIKISNDGYDYDRVLINKNKLLFNYEGATGVKTGYTKKAGRCLVSSANKNGIEVISVVINSPQMWERSKELLDDAFTLYSNKKVVDKCDFDRMFNSSSGKKVKFLIENDFIYPLTESEYSCVNYKFNGKNLNEYLKNPTKEVLFEVFVENVLIFSEKIFTILTNR